MWVSESELAVRLGIPSPTSDEITALQQAIQAAQSYLQDTTGFVEVGGSFEDRRSNLPISTYDLITKYRPVTSATAYSKVWRSSTESEVAVEVLDPANGLVRIDSASVWYPLMKELPQDPYLRRSVRLVYQVSSTSSPPSDLKEACIELAGHWYQLTKSGAFTSQAIGDIRWELDAEFERRVAHLLRRYSRVPT